MSSKASYESIRLLGAGSFGTAWLMRRRIDGCQCVIKDVKLDKIKSRREREWAKQEVQLLRSFEHQGIVRYLDSFLEPRTNELSIVMEFCDGGDLKARIDGQKTPFAEELVADWFAQLCLALKYVHDRRIIHRDIKPQNIFMMRSGQVVKLGDFGVARSLDYTMQLAQTSVGTPYYISPEIVNRGAYNNKTDVWSLGCVLYELLTLKFAFSGNSEKQLYMNIKLGALPPLPARYSTDLRTICTAMLRKNPKDRPGLAALLKREYLKPFLLKRVSSDELALLQIKPAQQLAALPSPVPAAPSPRPRTPAAAAQPAQQKRPAGVPAINVNNNNNRNAKPSPGAGLGSKRSPAPSPRPPTPGRPQTPAAAARSNVNRNKAPSTRTLMSEARRRELEREAAIKKAYEVKKRPSPAPSPLLLKQQQQRRQKQQAANSKDLERLSKKQQELDDKRQANYRQEGWINVLSPRSPPPQPPPPAPPPAPAAAVQAAGAAAVAGQNAAAAGRQAADRAQKLLNDFWERKRTRQRGALAAAAAGVVAEAAAEVAAANPQKRPTPPPQPASISQVLQEVRGPGPIQKVKLQPQVQQQSTVADSTLTSSSDTSIDQRRLKKELIASKRAAAAAAVATPNAWEARVVDAKRLEDFPLLPDTATLPSNTATLPSNRATLPSREDSFVARESRNADSSESPNQPGRREAWKDNTPGSVLLRRLGDAPLLADTADIQADASDPERQLCQSILQTLKELKLDEVDAKELLSTLTLVEADEAAGDRKSTRDQLLEVANDFQAMLEKQRLQQKQEEKEQQVETEQRLQAAGNTLSRAHSIPEGLCCSFQLKSNKDIDANKDSAAFEEASLEVTLKRRQRGKSVGDVNDDDDDEAEDAAEADDDGEDGDDVDSELDAVQRSLGEALRLASASSTATPQSPSPSPSPSIATSGDWDDDDGLPMEADEAPGQTSVGDAAVLAERLREELEKQIGFTKLLPAYDLAGKLEADDCVGVEETERRVREALGPQHADVYDKLMQLVLYDNQAVK